MEEKLQKEEGISLIEIFHLLLSKLKLLILVVIIGAICGGSFAIWRTIDVNYYGTEIQFYVNPDKPKDSSDGGSQFGVYGAYGRHVMDNMVKLLSSESFTEYLMLDMKSVPDKNNKWITTSKNIRTEEAFNKANQELTEKLNGAIDDVTKKGGLAEDAATKKEISVTAQKDMEDALYTLQDLWSQEVPVITLDGKTLGMSYWSYNEANYLVLNNQGVLSTALQLAYETFVTSEETAEVAAKEATEAVAALDARVEETLKLWRTTAQYKAELAKYSGKISYSYLGESDDFDDANNLARSFIYIKISVLNDESFANTLHEKIVNVVPAYVESHMAIPDGYSGTNCRRITRTDEIHLTNLHYTTKQAIKYGILFAMAAAVIASIVIIINDRSDKRLRDQETITRLFNVPVLGIVPTINDLKEESLAKKKNAYVKPKIKAESVGISSSAEPVEEVAVAEEPVNAPAEEPAPAEKTATPRKRRDTSNSPSNKKKRANKTEVK